MSISALAFRSAVPAIAALVLVMQSQAAHVGYLYSASSCSQSSMTHTLNWNNSVTDLSTCAAGLLTEGSTATPGAIKLECFDAGAIEVRLWNQAPYDCVSNTRQNFLVMTAEVASFKTTGNCTKVRNSNTGTSAYVKMVPAGASALSGLCTTSAPSPPSPPSPTASGGNGTNGTNGTTTVPKASTSKAGLAVNFFALPLAMVVGAAIRMV